MFAAPCWPLAIGRQSSPPPPLPSHLTVLLLNCSSTLSPFFLNFNTFRPPPPTPSPPRSQSSFFLSLPCPIPYPPIRSPSSPPSLMFFLFLLLLLLSFFHVSLSLLTSSFITSSYPSLPSPAYHPPLCFPSSPRPLLLLSFALVSSHFLLSSLSSGLGPEGLHPTDGQEVHPERRLGLTALLGHEECRTPAHAAVRDAAGAECQAEGGAEVRQVRRSGREGGSLPVSRPCPPFCSLTFGLF